METLKNNGKFRINIKAEFDEAVSGDPKPNRTTVPMYAQFQNVDERVDNKWLMCGCIVIDKDDNGDWADLVIIEYIPGEEEFTCRLLAYHLKVPAIPTDKDEYEQWCLDTAVKASDIMNVLLGPKEQETADWSFASKNLKDMKILFVKCPEDPKPDMIGKWQVGDEFDKDAPKGI